MTDAFTHSRYGVLLCSAHRKCCPRINTVLSSLSTTQREGRPYTVLDLRVAAGNCTESEGFRYMCGGGVGLSKRFRYIYGGVATGNCIENVGSVGHGHNREGKT